MSALPPGSIIGMLGGGQLGRMTALAAAPLGFEVHIFSPTTGPGTQVTSRHTLAAYDDELALASFASSVDVVTYEFENVPAATAAFLAERVPVRPGPRALAVCQHRVTEKTFLRDHGLPTTAWEPVGSREELTTALRTLGGPCVLKTARFGYDGKGQTMVRPGDDLDAAWAAIAGSSVEVEAILEAFYPFEIEASVVVARGVTGEIAAYELVQNEHRDHVLHRTTAPAPVSEAVRAEAQRIAHEIVHALDYVGVLGIELFVKADGTMAVNELAPRPHNSGHWTMDGCVTSQFEQHARAVTGLPLGSPKRVGTAEMLNLIGDDVDRLDAWLADPECKVHLYGKRAARPGRKMGHVNRIRTEA